MHRRPAPHIYTTRLVLTNPKPRDACAIFQYRSSPEVASYQSWHPKSESEVKNFIRRNCRQGFLQASGWHQLGIYLRTSLQLIGDIGIHFLPDDEKQLEIGFTVKPSEQGKGYATEAVRALLDYAFKNLRKHRVTASVDPRNAASIRLLEKIGMRQEGLFRKSIWTGKDWADDLRYALLDEEWSKSDS